MRRRVQLGERVLLVGSTPQLGDWEAEAGLEMQHGSDDWWCVQLEVPSGEEVQVAVSVVLGRVVQGAVLAGARALCCGDAGTRAACRASASPPPPPTLPGFCKALPVAVNADITLTPPASPHLCPTSGRVGHRRRRAALDAWQDDASLLQGG